MFTNTLEIFPYRMALTSIEKQLCRFL